MTDKVIDINVSRTLLFVLCAIGAGWFASQHNYWAFAFPVVFWLGERFYTG